MPVLSVDNRCESRVELDRLRQTHSKYVLRQRRRYGARIPGGMKLRGYGFQNFHLDIFFSGVGIPEAMPASSMKIKRRPRETVGTERRYMLRASERRGGGEWQNCHSIEVDKYCLTERDTPSIAICMQRDGLYLSAF